MESPRLHKSRVKILDRLKSNGILSVFVKVRV